MNISPNTPSSLYLSNYKKTLPNEMKTLFKTLPGGIFYEKNSTCLEIESPSFKSTLLNLTKHQINIDFYGAIRFEGCTICEEIPNCHIIFYKFENYPESVCSIQSYIDSKYFHEAVFKIQKTEKGFNISDYQSRCDLKARIGLGSTIYPLSQVFSHKIYQKRKEDQKKIFSLLLSKNILIVDIIDKINFIYDMLLSLEFHNLDI